MPWICLLHLWSTVTYRTMTVPTAIDCAAISIQNSPDEARPLCQEPSASGRAGACWTSAEAPSAHEKGWGGCVSEHEHEGRLCQKASNLATCV